MSRSGTKDSASSSPADRSSNRRTGFSMQTQNRTGMRRPLMLGAAALATAGILTPVETDRPRFYRDDPISVEPETQDASGVSPWKIDLFYDLLLNSFAHLGLPVGSRARNINTIDEVPDSSWFTNRILAKPLAVEDL